MISVSGTVLKNRTYRKPAVSIFMCPAQLISEEVCISAVRSVTGTVLKNRAYRKPAVSIFLCTIALTTSVCFEVQTEIVRKKVNLN